jgi:hypothetical protein
MEDIILVHGFWENFSVLIYKQGHVFPLSFPDSLDEYSSQVNLIFKGTHCLSIYHPYFVHLQPELTCRVRNFVIYLETA